jgi:hypothetical protein
METLPCPSCGHLDAVPGRVVGPEQWPASAFVPSHTGIGVKLRVSFRACLSCGHIWMSVPPEDLKSVIKCAGDELIKDYVIRLERGLYHDLPDIPETRRAADDVREIDTLVLAGQIVEATRRYRQLTGHTWDEVHAVIPHWAQLTRARRLAACGWRAKGTVDDEPELTWREHPMHDPALDG